MAFSSDLLKLWPNQRAALAHCQRYLSKPERSALVQMPTGSGKTGVLAVLASITAKDGAVLVVSPSKALVSQLEQDIGELFWSRIGAPKSWRPKYVRHLLPSTTNDITTLLQDTGGVGVVLVGTLVSLLEVQQKRDGSYGEFCEKIRLVIVDEGHREPALQWAEAVRGLEKPTILFTATPYRNDYKHFDVTEEWIHFLSFEKALAEHLIRDVQFESLRSNGTAADFVAKLVLLYDRWIRARRLNRGDRVIVRCCSAEAVRAVGQALVQALETRAENVLAVHETFSGVGGQFVAHIKNLRDTNETFLVHQYKLIEGIDDPRCSVLAIFQPFSNDRQLVQQIGRVIRHPEPRAGVARRALVLADNVIDYESRWHAYRQFDSGPDSRGGRPPVRNSASTVAKLLGSYPAVDYHRGRFRTTADFRNPTILNELRLPRSCVVYRLDAPSAMRDIAGVLGQLLVDDDREVAASGPIGGGCGHAFLCFAVDESPHLAPSFFPLLTLTVTVAVQSGRYLFIYDSAGLYADERIRGSRVEPAALHGLIPESESNQITSVSLLNADIGPSAIRSRTISAASLRDAVPFMGDNTNVVSRATGRVDAIGRRYLGFTRARVRDGDSAACTADEFVTWTAALARQLDSGDRAAVFFDRFAVPIEVPEDPTPTSILLETAAIESGFVGPNGEEINVTDACADIRTNANRPSADYVHSFVVSINDSPHQAWIKWDGKLERYRFLSPDLDRYHEKERPKNTITRFLNAEQEFRLTLHGSGTVYSAGSFYDIRLRNARGGADRLLLDLLTEVAALDDIASEKGKRSKERTHSSWDRASLFNFIDSAMKAADGGVFARSFADVVCDDMGNEGADFIGVERGGGSIVFVQAKCRKTTAQVSASALYDVCAQAAKNLAFLRYGAQERTDRTRLWNGNWNGDYSVRPRIRKGRQPAKAFVANMNESLRKPATRREMWLVLGQTLSKSKLAEELMARQPPAYAIQTFYLLMATHNSCKSVGVDLRVFCSP